MTTGCVRVDSARDQILKAATRQFANRGYSQVSLDDILTEAQLTKGAMYFHFPSKYALAVSIIELYTEQTRSGITELISRRMSALESLIGISFHTAVQDATTDVARAGVHLLEAVGRTENLQEKRIADWTTGFTRLASQAIDEGDIAPGTDPEEISKLAVAMYTGIRQTSDLSQPAQFITNLASIVQLALPGFVNPDRIGYFRQFVQRRAAIALRNVTSLA